MKSIPLVGRLLGMTLLLMVSAMMPGWAEVGTPGAGFQPTWQVGQSWVIEARYRNLAAGENSWLPPVRWLFHVRGTRQAGSEPCFLLHILPLGRPEMKIQAVVWVSARDLRPVRVFDIFPQRGRATTVRRDFDPERLTPLLADSSMIPYDLPLFPHRGDDSAPVASAAEVVGEKAVQINTTTFVDRVDQRWIFRDGGYDVTLHDAGARGTVFQRWVPGCPWAVWSRSQMMETRLVDPAPAGAEGRWAE